MKTNVALVILLCFCHVHFSYQQKSERCTKAPESGPCLARIPRLYYDSATNVCKEFFYGGCQGNDNNFESLEECHRECTEGGSGQGNITGDRCAQKPEQGECKALLERYHYDTDSNSCKLFTYGGCGGNQNNFETEEQCQSACVKSNSKDGDRCSLKPEVGVCMARIPRLYYDPESNKCKEFFYGGCGGNANNFETVEECDKACVSMSRADRCYAEMVQGPCKSNLRRLYFDHLSNTCKEFTYGGCGGNENNFETYEACSSACIKTSTGDKCSQSADRGNCRAMMLRYYYNSTFQECVEFVYGGCGGNENNFESHAECVDECGNSAPALAFTSIVIITITSLALITITQW